MSTHSEKRPLEGQRALVTGANTGIGAAIAEGLANAGAEVNAVNYEYIIIGSGAGGSAAAYRLALAGKRVLLVEKGRALPSRRFDPGFNQVITQGAFKSQERWLDRKGRQFAPEEYFNLGGKTIGERAYGFFLQTEDGSAENNRVVAQTPGR